LAAISVIIGKLRLEFIVRLPQHRYSRVPILYELTPSCEYVFARFAIKPTGLLDVVGCDNTARPRVEHIQVGLIDEARIVAAPALMRNAGCRTAED